MKRIVGTVITVCVVLALLVLSVTLNEQSPTDAQWATLKILVIVCGCSAAYCFIVGELTRNFSQIDKLWSLLPIAYTWIIAVKGGMNARLIAYALIVTAWGIRLTVNFARKGAYRLKFWTGTEDYRWSIVRQNPAFKHGIVWVLFDLLFISVYQNLLVLAICLPALVCMGSSASLGVWDIAAAVLAILFLALETVADEYQWRFYQTKQKRLADGKTLEDLPMPYRLGFNTRGPWSVMRHPNYLGEQGIWISLYLFAVGAGAGVFNWTAIGPLLLILLFMGSSTLGESISSGKYPLYKKYVQQVCKYLPLRRFDPDR
ncbi:MAG: DUF1295 domain-containing protein [Acutalibacteraceae bacterium]|jgi:steroid 5-alpha reductase family enzyme